MSYATLKRMLTKLVAERCIVIEGQGKGTRYFLSPSFELVQPISIDEYYEKEIDERQIKETFNFELVNKILNRNSVFTEKELEKLDQLQRCTLQIL